jgi:glycosyltransferase involved in cell wall biosynthesis
VTAGTVTVVIPTRDRDHLLRRALASVAAQTLPPLEVVVVGDGCTPDIGDELGLDVRVVVAPAGTGAGECRNIGARQARGDWVALLDDDDEWLPTKLERQLAAAGSGQHTVVACRVRVGGGSAPALVWPRRLPARDERVSDYLLRRRALTMGETLLQTSMLLVRRDVLLQVPFTRGLRRHQEWDWLIRVEAARLLRLAFVETVESVWHSDDGPRITHGGDWRSSLAWVRSLRGLASEGAIRSFVLTFVPRIARQGDGGWKAVLPLLSAARAFGRPRARELALFAACWATPSQGSRLGTALRSGRLGGSRRPPPDRQVAAARRWSHSVLVVQPYVAKYREGFYEELRSQLAAKGIALSLLVGSPQGESALRSDAVRLPWATEVPAHLVSVGGRLMRFKRGWRGPPPDLVVLPHGSGWMDNYAVLARRRQLIGLWGQGRPYTTDGHPLDRALERWQLSRADHYFAYTEAGGRSVQAGGWPAERVTVLHNTSGTSELTSLVRQVTPQETRELRNGLTRGRTALFVGGLDAAKRIDFLIQAGDRIHERLDGFTLLVAGAGKDEALVREAAASRHWLRFFGRVEAAEKARLATVSDVLVMPGRVGLVAVDSFALGVPIVTTAWPWHAPEFEYLDEGNSVVSQDTLDDYVEAVCALLTDEPRRTTLAARCRADADVYTTQQMALRFVDGVERVLHLRSDVDRDRSRGLVRNDASAGHSYTHSNVTTTAP